jgi:hypothetical protein
LHVEVRFAPPRFVAIIVCVRADASFGWDGVTPASSMGGAYEKTSFGQASELTQKINNP